MKFLNSRFILFLVLMLSGFSLFPQDIAEDAHIVLFYSETCPHCKKEMEYLQILEERNPQVIVKYYNIEESFEEWKYFDQKLDLRTGSVPRTIIGDTSFIGFSENYGPRVYNKQHNAYIGFSSQIIKSVENLTGQNLDVPFRGKINLFYIVIPLVFLLGAVLFWWYKSSRKKQILIGILTAFLFIFLFVLLKRIPEGEFSELAKSTPFPVFVSLIALADGFNPCAFSVLLVFLSLLAYTNRKSGSFTLGILFIVTSAIMYFLIVLLLILIGSVFLERFEILARFFISAVILTAGALNVKDFFFFKKGVSLSISEKNNSKIAKISVRIMKHLKTGETNRRAWMSAIVLTIGLAVFVNFVELGCTAIFPVIYLSALMSRFGDFGAPHILYTILYSIIFIIPLTGVLVFYLTGVKTVRLTEEQGRYLKLFSGILLLSLGILFLVNPGILSFA
jgi:cytochrome c biogenesis protein CcdA/thiol-disulfide isomerase/thioredoxin